MRKKEKEKGKGERKQVAGKQRNNVGEERGEKG
jgi:hypothetical protein